ncbi:SRPBCC family protein [Vineibacter terrae]|uniref:SRPBCC family protein n=1 Tax=Vineibacter terrae TaxID=2586908 RepID=A0A5C8PU10_9HYPH|nr:SRPBCC family protein [Vineibacter terrae]TXL81818.1 SRPBCC family protein [Vineibacter terrae]
MSDDGQLGTDTVVRFERVLPGPIERVWAYLTTSAHLAGWLGEGTIEPRAGGAVDIGKGHIRGIVTQWKPPRLLAYTWNVFGPDDVESPFPESYVMIELKPHGDDVLLTLTHRPILAGFEGLTRTGWHTLLDMLGALLRGEEPEPRQVLMERNRLRYGVEKLPG